jgi:hypothetical protein
MALSDSSILREVVACLASGRLRAPHGDVVAPVKQAVEIFPARTTSNWPHMPAGMWLVRTDNSPIVPGSVCIRFTSQGRAIVLRSHTDGTILTEHEDDIAPAGGGVTNSIDWLMGSLSLATPATSELEVTYSWRPDLQRDYA